MPLIVSKQTFALLELMQEKFAPHLLERSALSTSENSLELQVKLALDFFMVLKCFINHFLTTRYVKWTYPETQVEFEILQKLLSEQAKIFEQLNRDNDLYSLKIIVDGRNMFPFGYLLVCAFAELKPSVQNDFLALMDALINIVKLSPADPDATSMADKMVRFISQKFIEIDPQRMISFVMSHWTAAKAALDAPGALSQKPMAAVAIKPEKPSVVSVFLSWFQTPVSTPKASAAPTSAITDKAL